MSNLLEQAINCSDGDQAAKIIQDALGIESDDVANYVFPKTWPADREQRARIIGEWLQTEVRFWPDAPLAASRRPGRMGAPALVSVQCSRQTKSRSHVPSCTEGRRL